MSIDPILPQEYQRQLENGSSIQLFLSVPAGLEDVTVWKLPTLLVKAASKISYRIGSGYLMISLLQISPPATEGDGIMKAIADLVQHPPVCIFAAYVSIGTIAVPKKIFDSSKDLLSYVLSGFQEPCQQDQRTHTDLGLRWHEGLAILRSTPSLLAERLALFSHQDFKVLSDMNPIRFRASFDRGEVKHKGVRSQDIASGLGGVTGKIFSEWSVDLTDYDIEVMGRWIPEDLEEVDIKLPDVSFHGNSDTDPVEGNVQDTMKMQVGMTLPLALSTCPYRFRPMDGRTSLKIEIAYTLLAMVDPKPGNLVVDVCSGVGTIPIVGAAHYPDSFFAGLEVVPYNVEKAEGNSRAMIEKVNQERLKSHSVSSSSIIKSRPFVRGPSLLVGDARAICWRSNTVDLIVSDLPWGQRESSHLSNCKLYPKLIKEIIRILKVDGRALLVTGERKLLQRQLDAPFAKPHLKLLQKREITIGFKVMVFELQRL
ncbi:THUMP domain-containing protein 3 [Entomortierella lignicola]|nr:THUMP domain-containing protein 3 [Entomortierella lignicola]